MRGGNSASGARVLLLEADPDLASDLPEAELELARTQSMVRVIEIGGRKWNPAPLVRASRPGWLGLFLLRGVLIRRVMVGKRTACELFGPGDVFRPWDADGEYEPLPITLDWLVLRPSRLAVLDTAFSMRMVRWPTITSRLVERVAQRARYLALTQAVTHLPRTHSRLLILFWLLADRWGRMGHDGVRVRLPLTHTTLAMLVGSQRPSVTLALQRLTRAELLIREGEDRWLLTRRAIELLDDPESLAVVEDQVREGEEA